MQAPRSALTNPGILNAEIGYIRSRMRLGLALRGPLRGHLRVRKKAKPCRSRGAFFLFAPELSSRHFQKTTPPTRPSSDAPGSGNRRMHHDRRRRTVARIERSEIRGRSRGFYRRSPGFAALNPGYKIFSDSLPAIKGSRTPTDAGLPASPSGEARTLARARSPVGVPLRLSPGRQLVPKAQRQAMLSGTVRSVRSCTAAPTGEWRPCASPCMIRKSGCRFSGRIMHHSRALPAPKQIPVQ